MNDYIRLSAPHPMSNDWYGAKLGDIELAVRGSAIQSIPSIAAFIPMAVLIASRMGRNLRIDGCIDGALLTKLNYEYAPFVSRFYDGHCVSISASEIGHGPVPRRQRSALMFSAGIDSFYSLHLLTRIGMKPDAFLNIHAGAHDDNLETWSVRLANVRSVGDELGISVETIETNFHRVYSEAHVRCHTFRNVAAAMAASDIGVLYYSAAHEVSELSFAAAKLHGLDFIDPAIIRSFLSAEFEAIYLGWDADRIARTNVVSRMPIAFKHLDICTNQNYQALRRPENPINCGECRKCIRTLVALDVAGALDDFAHAFDIGCWRRTKGEAIRKLAMSEHPIDLSAVNLARSAEATGTASLGRDFPSGPRR